MSKNDKKLDKAITTAKKNIQNIPNYTSHDILTLTFDMKKIVYANYDIKHIDKVIKLNNLLKLTEKKVDTYKFNK